MGFQRAQWHSGLTYQQTCPTCKTVLQYTDYSLDFRPWYADGFVDCPKCKTHLRHNESYAIDTRQSKIVAAPTPEPALAPAPEPTPEPVPEPAPAPEQPAYSVSLAEQAGTAPVLVAEPAPTDVPAPVAETPAYAVNLSEQPARLAPTPAVKPLFCTYCGNKFGENDRFCAMCGTKRG